MTNTPICVIGVPTFNKVKHVESSIRSLLDQTVQDVRLIICDENSQDGSLEILRRLAEADPRIHLQVNQQRLGYIANANQALTLAQTLYPGCPYFAWASDHDLWHPTWVAEMVEALETGADVVAVWSWADRLDDDGAIIDQDKPALDMGGSDRAMDRFRFAAYGLHAGTSVYALFRRSALDQLGGFRYVIDPDRMLLMELSLLGRFGQVPRILWSRRYVGLANRGRQRRSFFPGRIPFTAYAPRSLQHISILMRDTSLRGLFRPYAGRGMGPILALLYLLQRRHRLLEMLERRVRPLPRAFRYQVVKPILMQIHRVTKRLKGYAGPLFRQTRK